VNETLSPNVIALIYLLASVLFILALKGLSSPLSARRGNRFGIAGMTIAVATTLLITRRIDLTLAALDDIAATPPPRWTQPLELDEVFDGWSRIATDPGPFLGLGLTTGGWLESALPVLAAHERPAELAGDALIHFDVRSDNICFWGDRAVFVDWNLAARGNPLFDLAAWLPSLAAEGGPAPETVAPDAGVFAAALAGYFCSHAPLPPIPDAPRVRAVQLQQAMTSLPWAARWLSLPPPDGSRLTGGV